MPEDSFLEKVARGTIKLSTAISRTVVTVMAKTFVIMIDRSYSMAARCGRMNRLAAAQNATIAMLDVRLQQGVDDQLSLIAFDEKADVVLRFAHCNRDRDIIENAIRSITIRGGTSLTAPLVAAKKILPSNADVHLVMLTDGHGGNPLQVARSLKNAGALIETVGVGDHPSEVNETVLKETASILNGKTLYRFLSDADDLMHYFRTQIANRLVKVNRS